MLPPKLQNATAANYKAKADLLQANLAYLLAWAELQRTVGRTPGTEGTAEPRDPLVLKDK